MGPEAGASYPSKLGYPAKCDKAAKDVRADDFDILVLPGWNDSEPNHFLLHWVAAFPNMRPARFGSHGIRLKKRSAAYS